VEFCFRLTQLVRVQAAGLGEQRAARCLDGVVDFVLQRRFAFSVADDGWERGQQGPYRRRYGAEGGGELGAQRPGDGGRLGEWFQSFRVQHLAADWVDQQPVGGQEI
jgi:hypothetical protein